MLELLCLKSEMARVGFCLCSWLLLMINMRWNQLISYITSSWWAYLIINSMSQILRIMQLRSAKYLLVANLRCTGNLMPCTHFKVKRLKTAEFNYSQVHWRILGLRYMSHYVSSSPANVPTLENSWSMLQVSLCQLQYCEFANAIEPNC